MQRRVHKIHRRYQFEYLTAITTTVTTTTLLMLHCYHQLKLQIKIHREGCSTQANRKFITPNIDTL